MHKKQNEDQVAIDQKMEAHRQDYVEKRKQLLEAGKRRTTIYRLDRTKEVVDVHTGPELAIVLKGMVRP